MTDYSIIYYTAITAQKVDTEQTLQLKYYSATSKLQNGSTYQNVCKTAFLSVLQFKKHLIYLSIGQKLQFSPKLTYKFTMINTEEAVHFEKLA